MKQLKVYVIVMSLLLFGALVTGVYVWYTVQTMNRDLDTVYEELEERVEKQRAKAGPATSSSAEPVLDTLLVTEATEAVPVSLSAETLTDEQRARLESFAVKGEPLVITPALIACATEAVGESRLGEIVAGGAPSPRELVALLPCLKK